MSTVRKFGMFIVVILISLIYLLSKIDLEIDLGIYRVSKTGFDTSVIKASLKPLFFLAIGIAVLVLINKTEKLISIRLSLGGRDISLIAALFLLLLELLVIITCVDKCYGFYNTYELERSVDEMRSFVSGEKTVIHAAGTYISGDAVYTYSNSREALENCYETGNRIAELDFIWTSDGQLVCGHDDEKSWCYGIDSSNALSEEGFLNSKLFGTLTTMSLDNLAVFLQTHEDLLIVTDIKDDNTLACKFIADNYPELMDRFIVQIYHMDEYDAIRNLGFKYMIYTLYRTEADEREKSKLVSDINSHDFVGLTFWYDWIETKDIYDDVKDIGIPIFVHTVNDKSEIDNCMDMNLLIYTDNTDNGWLR